MPDRVEPDILIEMRRRVAAQLTLMGWPMYEDDDGDLMLKVGGFFDATLAAAFRVLHDLEDERSSGEGDDA